MAALVGAVVGAGAGDLEIGMRIYVTTWVRQHYGGVFHAWHAIRESMAPICGRVSPPFRWSDERLEYPLGEKVCSWCLRALAKERQV